MTKVDKFILKIISGKVDHDIDFEKMVDLLITRGFHLRIKGSHHILWKENVSEIINVQSIRNKAKPYQVKQVRNILIKYKLIDNEP